MHKKKQDAIFPLSLFDIRTYKIGILGNFFTRLGISSIPIMIPLLLQLVFDYTAIQAGWMISAMALGTLISKLFIVSVIKKVGYRVSLIVNTIALGIMLIGFAPLTHYTYSLPLLVSYLFILGMLSSIQYTSMNTITMSELPTPLKSSGTSLMTVNQQLSTGIGIALAAFLLDQYHGYLSSYQTTFEWLFITIGILTVLSTLVFKNLKQDDGLDLI
ncbi:MAG: MFS transporter [Neisseriaceae bacterium]|nr:MFS transporter [Neisseriaceae bacterium]